MLDKHFHLPYPSHWVDLNITSERKVLSFLGAQPLRPWRLPVPGFTLPTPAPSGTGGRMGGGSWLLGGPGRINLPRASSQQPRFHLDGRGQSGGHALRYLSSSALPLPPGPAWPAPSEALRQPRCLRQALTRLAGLPGSRGLSKHLHGFS